MTRLLYNHNWAGDLSMLEPKRITAYPEANEQLLYFTSSSLLKNDEVIIFISDRTGSPNIFARNILTEEEWQLTYNDQGYLKSYVYFDGNNGKGLGKASISLDPENAIVYFIQGREICAVNMQGEMRVLATLPDGQVTAFTHISSDGSRLCVPTTDARALEGYNNLNGHSYDIDQRVREEKLNSYIRVFDTSTGMEILTETVPQAWITHVQFCPTDHHMILYNHEWPSDCGVRRMWLWDGKKHRRLRDENEQRSRKDWTCHEMWERNGREIIYHGSYHNGLPYVGKLSLNDMQIIEIPFPQQYRKYGHFTVSNQGLLVTDGYYEIDEEAGSTIILNHAPMCARYISVLKPLWEAKKLEWIPVCSHDSSWNSQDSHPHPIFNHKSDAIFFTSDKEGKRAIYMCSVTKTIQ